MYKVWEDKNIQSITVKYACYRNQAVDIFGDHDSSLLHKLSAHTLMLSFRVPPPLPQNYHSAGIVLGIKQKDQGPVGAGINPLCVTVLQFLLLLSSTKSVNVLQRPELGSFIILSSPFAVFQLYKWIILQRQDSLSAMKINSDTQVLE